MSKPTRFLALTASLLWLSSPVFAGTTPCSGDCDGNREITIDEIIMGVRIALGEAELSSCDAADLDRDGRVTVDEILAAVTAALEGCEPGPTETATVAPSATETIVPTITATAIVTSTSVATGTPAETPTIEATDTPTEDPTGTPDGSETPTPIVTETMTPADTGTPTGSETATPLESATPTPAVETPGSETPAIATETATIGSTEQPTATGSETPTPSDTAVPTATTSGTPDGIETATATAAATETSSVPVDTATPGTETPGTEIPSTQTPSTELPATETPTIGTPATATITPTLEATATATTTSTPNDMASGFAAEIVGDTVELSWTPPEAGSGNEEVLVLRRLNAMPDGPTDENSEIVFRGAAAVAEDAIIHLLPSLSGQARTYFYTVYGCQAGGDCDSEGVSLSVVPTLTDVLRGGGYVIHWRHASADQCLDMLQLGNAATTSSPNWWRSCVSDCTMNTARQLNATGNAESIEIGNQLRARDIPFGRVLSSEFCRNFNTANLMSLGAPLEQLPEITFFVYDEMNRCAKSFDLIEQVPAAGTNTAIIGHAGFNTVCQPLDGLAWAEAAIFKPDGQGGALLITRVKANEWAALAQ